MLVVSDLHIFHVNITLVIAYAEVICFSLDLPVKAIGPGTVSVRLLDHLTKGKSDCEQRAVVKMALIFRESHSRSILSDREPCPLSFGL